jgi:WD40 repeat protein
MAVAFSPDGRLALSGGRDAKVRVWNLETGRATHVLAGHGKAVWAVAFTPDGRTGLSGGGDEVVKLWDLATGKPVETP